MSKRKLPPPADFDENPVWTPEMHARARPADEVHGTEIAASMVRKPGRPVGYRKPNAKKSVTLRLDPDVIEAWRATGPGWNGRMNDVLRQALGK